MLRKKRLAAVVLLILLTSFVLFCTAAEVYSLRPHNCCHTRDCHICAVATFATERLFDSAGRIAAVVGAAILLYLYIRLTAVKCVSHNSVYSLYKVKLLN